MNYILHISTNPSPSPPGGFVFSLCGIHVNDPSRYYWTTATENVQSILADFPYLTACEACSLLSMTE
jgi:hypothetical protein